MTFVVKSGTSIFRRFECKHCNCMFMSSSPNLIKKDLKYKVLYTSICPECDQMCSNYKLELFNFLSSLFWLEY